MSIQFFLFTVISILNYVSGEFLKRIALDIEDENEPSLSPTSSPFISVMPTFSPSTFVTSAPTLTNTTASSYTLPSDIGATVAGILFAILAVVGLVVGIFIKKPAPPVSKDYKVLTTAPGVANNNEGL
jgi:hypothetical protein